MPRKAFLAVVTALEAFSQIRSDDLNGDMPTAR